MPGEQGPKQIQVLATEAWSQWSRLGMLVYVYRVQAVVIYY